MALFQSREFLPEGGSIQEKEGLRKSQRNFKNPGYMVLYKALEEPLRKLLVNAYGDNSDSEISSIMASLMNDVEKAILNGTKNKNKKVDMPTKGHDVLVGENADLFERGIIDPVKVTRTALENASVATMILTTEALVTDIPEEKKDNPAGGMPGGMDY